MADLVEAVARAIARSYFCNSFYREPDGTMTTDAPALAMLERKVNEGWHLFTEHARAALAALEAEGYLVVSAASQSHGEHT